MPKKFDAYFIIPLPPGGIPKKYMGIIKSVREQYGEVYVNIYQTCNFFRARVGTRGEGEGYGRYIRTFIWMEVGSKPLKIRENPDWPLQKQGGTTR